MTESNQLAVTQPNALALAGEEANSQPYCCQNDEWSAGFKLNKNINVILTSHSGESDNGYLEAWSVTHT